MQNALPLQAERQGRASATRWVITTEMVAYLAIAISALVLRLAELDTVPLTHDEAAEALAAWRTVMPGASGSALVPHSAFNFLSQALSFMTLGGHEVSARLGTVLAGVALVLLPVLFRGILGVGRALVLSLLLLASPVLLGASRFGSPAVWAMLSAGVMLWGVYLYNARPSAGYAVIAAGAAASLLFLSDPAGMVLALILAGAGILTVLTNPIDEDADDLPDEDERPAWYRVFPWTTALGLAALWLFAVSTVFLLHPPGLSAVGESLVAGLTGFFQPYPNATPLFVTVVALFYEPFAAVFALVGLFLLALRGSMGAIERFFIAWVVLGLFASLVYVGASPSHALWMTVPLAGLASYTGLHCLVATTEDRVLNVPVYARWVVALLMIGLMFLASIPFQDLSRSLVGASDLANVQADPSSVVLLILAALFLGVGYLLISSLWDAKTALRGIGIGALIFGGMTSLGSGWAFSVTHSEDATLLFHQRTTHRDLFLLRETLQEVAAREQNDFIYYLPVVAYAPDDGALAWMLRDFDSTTYISDLVDAVRQPIVILPEFGAGLDLGAPYVGQDFTVGRGWEARRLNPLDFPAWWSQGRSRTAQVRSDTVILWLRQDIYQGVPPDSALQG